MTASNGRRRQGTGQQIVRASGTVPWRVRSGRLQVAVIHRPQQDDWSWPKGKLGRGEDWPCAAVREAWEETGLRMRLGIPLPTAEYSLSGASARKRVRYWSAEITGGRGRLRHEVDDVRWLEPPQARRLLSASRDRALLQVVLEAHRANGLSTRPFAVIRHAKALPRRRWTDDDWLRPLDDEGRAQAERLSGLLRAYGIDRLLSSSSTRCVDTLRPYARDTRFDLAMTYTLSEEGYARRPKHALATLERHLDGPRPGALCTHGPLIPTLLEALVGRARGPAKAELRQAAQANLDKGEVLIAHLDRTDRVVAVERFNTNGPPGPTESA